MTTVHPCDLRPCTDRCTHRIVTAAITELDAARQLDPDHPAVHLHLVASLLQQTDILHARGVADLARRGYSTTAIAILLGLG